MPLKSTKGLGRKVNFKTNLLGVYLQTDFEKKKNPPIHLMAIQTTI